MDGIEEKIGYLTGVAKATEERLGRVQAMVETHMDDERAYREAHAIKLAALEVIAERQVRMEDTLNKIDHRDTTTKAIVHTFKLIFAVLIAILTFHFGDVKPILAGLRAIWVG